MNVMGMIWGDLGALQSKLLKEALKMVSNLQIYALTPASISFYLYLSYPVPCAFLSTPSLPTCFIFTSTLLLHLLSMSFRCLFDLTLYFKYLILTSENTTVSELLIPSSTRTASAKILALALHSTQEIIFQE